MASLKKRNNTWYAVWYQDGKNVIKTTGIHIKGAKEKKLAQQTADAMESVAKNEVPLAAALDSLRAAAELSGFQQAVPTIREYLLKYVPNGKESHASNVKRAISLFLEYLALDANKRLDWLAPAACRDFFRQQLKRVSYGTVRLYKAYLTSAFKQAVDDDILRRNPISAVSLPKEAGDQERKAVQREPFSADELRIIFTQFSSPWREMAITSFLTGGQRVGDIALLKWEQVDFEAGVINFRTMKTGKKLSSPMLPYLAQLLVDMPKTNEYVFPFAAKRYIRSKGNVSVEFTAQLRAHGIGSTVICGSSSQQKSVSTKSFHSIRHSVVSMLRSDNRFSADLTREIVGHDSEEVERGYYTASNEHKLRGLQHLLELTR